MPDPVTPPEPNAGGTPPAPDDQLIAGKFKTQDDLVAAYKELEQKLGTTPPKDPPKDPPADQGGPAKIDYAALSDEIARDGKLSDASRASLIASGMPESIIDDYVESQATKVTAFKQGLMEAVGGEQAFGIITAWGAQNLSQQEQEYFQAEIGKGPEAAKAAMELLKGRFEKVMGKMPALLTGGKPDATSGGFTSLDEQKAAQRDPRYRTDAAYREQVLARIAASTGY